MMKYPEMGKVKARLAQSIGAEAATGLYRAFIQDTLMTVQSLDIPFHIAMYPPESQEQFEQWFGPSYRFFLQQGTNLGERLQNGFATMFKKEYQQVIALASDCPDLPIEILQTAVSSLQTNKVVIGPAYDGGYYLIGFSYDLFIPDVFEDITWSTESVFRETMTRIESVTHQVYVLPEWADIDTKNDLQRFYKTYQMQPSKTLHAMKFLRSHPGLLHILFS
ncbi:MAG: TIGR04282 family arsenosugar biosynthesis glycosyltransferase [Candidatus Thorarchaeota archaeon]|jgi:rSAM/selenodomain-associated transferase 1